jgi:protein TonB
MDANRTSSAYELKNELARYSLASKGGDGNLKLAWVNSVCVLFLIIGIVGARRGVISIKTLPPIREVVPVVVIPVTLPPQKAVQPKKEQSQQQNQPRVFVALPNTPNVNFSVPTIGNIVAPGQMAPAPPLNPMQPQEQIASVGNTGTGGERPQPPYPQLAMQNGEQGTIVLLLSTDASGNVVTVDVKRSSGFPFLDQETVAFVKNHWHLPTNIGTQRFQTSITYKLQF